MRLNVALRVLGCVSTASAQSYYTSSYADACEASLDRLETFTNILTNTIGVE